MNKSMVIRLIIISIGLLLYSHLILSLYYIIWISKQILISYYVCFYSFSVCYFFIILLEMPVLGDKIYHCIKKPGFIIHISFFSIMILYEIILFSINLHKFSNYWINCPFTISEPYEKLHHKRRCELYGINNNSRYKFQYICSYDSYLDFAYDYHYYYVNGISFIVKSYKKIKQIIETDYVRCVQFTSVIINNPIVTEFNKEYLSENKYYCGRTNQPVKNNFVEDKECNNKTKKNLFYLFDSCCFLQIFYVIFFYSSKKILEEDERRNYNQNNDVQNIQNDNEKSRSSTNLSNRNDNIYFRKLNTKNIIFVDKKEEIINQDIQIIYVGNKSPKINNNISSGEEVNKIRKDNNQNNS